MNWKRYKTYFQDNKPDESHFITGIDLGDDSSALAFYNVLRGQSEIMDPSGGYGRASVPTMMQYASKSKEWIFGEYAMLNKGVGAEITLVSLMEKLGRKEFIDLDGKAARVATVLGMYLKELIGGLKNINPKAEVAGIVACIPNYMDEAAKDELKWAFKAAGCDGELVCLASDRECALTAYFAASKPRSELLLLLDYGARELRGGVYQIDPAANYIDVAAKSVMLDKSLGASQIDKELVKLFLESFPKEVSKQEMEQLSSFLYQHKDFLLQNSWKKPVKLYFNFVYPPLQCSITQERMRALIKPFEESFEKFISNLLSINADNTPISKNDISTVACVGGGFEMQWVKDSIARLLPKSRVVFFKHSKGALAEGAALICAKKLEILDSPSVIVADQLRLTEDYGIAVRANRKEVFVPVVNRGSFWWEQNSKLFFIVNQPVKNGMTLPLFRRDQNGEVRHMETMRLEGLPDRPRGVTKLKLDMRFEGIHTLKAKIADCGFGEMYPKSDYEKTVEIYV
ncbi:MAG: DUF5716 family protein [Clostridiales bacterium]|jgi:molecular chaperone DnaK (HSP70)|nr:DUF5716 family protein [Clostridiales bacterium]